MRLKRASIARPVEEVAVPQDVMQLRHEWATIVWAAEEVTSRCDVAPARVGDNRPGRQGGLRPQRVSAEILPPPVGARWDPLLAMRTTASKE